MNERKRLIEHVDEKLMSEISSVTLTVPFRMAPGKTSTKLVEHS